MKESSNL